MLNVLQNGSALLVIEAYKDSPVTRANISRRLLLVENDLQPKEAHLNNVGKTTFLVRPVQVESEILRVELNGTRRVVNKKTGLAPRSCIEIFLFDLGATHRLTKPVVVRLALPCC